MKAIVNISQTSQGQRVSLLGLGQDENAARRAAYAFVHGGHNDFEQQHAGGTLLDVAPRLAELSRRGDGWHETYDQEGHLVGGEASEASFALEQALARLVVDQGRLDYRS